MAWFDLPLDELRRYRPEPAEPDDFDAFWADTLAEARAHELGARFERVETGLRLLESYDVEFAGFGGATIKAWLHLPAGQPGPLPAVVQYQGYGSGRGLVHQEHLYALAGYAHLMMDTRGQGSAGSPGDTPDPDGGGDPAHPGFMTRGILDPATYYYRRVFTDAVRAVEAVRSHPAVDASRVAVTGGSQGGGITLAAAALVPDLRGAAPDVPFLCDFPRATTLVDTDPYGEIVRYLKTHRDHVARATATLAYFDGVSMARRSTAPALFSVGLMDQICPPSSVYAAYNHYAGPKAIIEYPYNDHEGGAAFQERAKLDWLAARLSSGAA
jgi:cephalosporin-C deacetylase